MTQTPEDRRAADSAVEVLGAAATLAPFTVRTLKFKLLVTSTVRRHPAGPGGPGPRALTAAGPRLTEVGRDPGPGSGSVTPPALEPWGRDRAASYITDMVMLV